jgi:hypothetical protein
MLCLGKKEVRYMLMGKLTDKRQLADCTTGCLHNAAKGYALLTLILTLICPEKLALGAVRSRSYYSYKL